MGGAAGRAVSDNITSVFSNVEGATQKATTMISPPPRTYIQRPAQPDFSGVQERSADPEVVGKAAPQRAQAMPAPPQVTAAAPAYYIKESVETSYSLKHWVGVGLTVEAPTPERISQIKAGEAVENLGMQLGMPANLVTIPGADGRLWQRVKYKNAGRDAGVIYVADGKVIEVVPARP